MKGYFKCPFFMIPPWGNGRKSDMRLESRATRPRKEKRKKPAPQELHGECPHRVSSFNSNLPVFIWRAWRILMEFSVGLRQFLPPSALLSCDLAFSVLSIPFQLTNPSDGLLCFLIHLPSMLPLNSPPLGYVFQHLHIWSEHPFAAPRPGPKKTGVSPRACVHVWEKMLRTIRISSVIRQNYSQLYRERTCGSVKENQVLRNRRVC